MNTSREVTKAIITAAGVGTRFLPFTKSIAKEMTPVLNFPTIHYVVGECIKSGIKDIVVVVGESDNSLRNYYEQSIELEEFLERVGKLELLEEIRNISKTAKITFINQDKKLPYGNGSPVLSAKSVIGNENFAVLLGDLLAVSDPPTVSQLKSTFEASDCAGVISAFNMKKSEMPKHGMIILKKGSQDHLESVIEKPDLSEVVSTLSSRGRYVFSPKIFDYLNPENTGKNDELWLVDAIEAMNKDFPVLVKKINGNCYTVGDPLNFLKTNIEFGLRSEDLRDKLREYLQGLSLE